jgi:hypothetical protein
MNLVTNWTQTLQGKRAGGAKTGPKPRPVADRFWGKVQKSQGCWLWTGAVSSSGYGTFLYSPGKFISAHRVALLLAGAAPAGKSACHECDVKLCCRPDHLFWGSPADNINDAKTKGRIPKGESHGNSKLTWATVREIRRIGKAETQSVLAARFNTTQTRISAILLGQAWKE